MENLETEFYLLSILALLTRTRDGFTMIAAIVGGITLLFVFNVAAQGILVIVDQVPFPFDTCAMLSI